jgi:hypothetical protein
VFATEPAPEEIRALAIEDLGFLGDERVLGTLALLIQDPALAIQMAALRAVRSYPTPRAEEILANAAGDPALSDGPKLYAVESMAFFRTRTAKQFLENVKESPSFSSKLQAAAQKTLQRAWP